MKRPRSPKFGGVFLNQEIQARHLKNPDASGKAQVGHRKGVVSGFELTDPLAFHGKLVEPCKS